MITRWNVALGFIFATNRVLSLHSHRFQQFHVPQQWYVLFGIVSGGDVRCNQCLASLTWCRNSFFQCFSPFFYYLAFHPYVFTIFKIVKLTMHSPAPYSIPPLKPSINIKQPSEAKEKSKCPQVPQICHYCVACTQKELLPPLIHSFICFSFFKW